MTATKDHLEYIRRLVREQSAIVLNEDKGYLIEARLKPVMQIEGFDSFDELVMMLRSKPRGLVTMVVEALTTNETSFFRDNHPFETMKEVVIPELIKARAGERQLKIWCAASSTGQEPVSLGMLLRENFPELKGWDVSILATDINETILERSRSGFYSQLEVSRGLPEELRAKYFEQADKGWKVKSEVLDLIEYRQMNLAEPFPPMPKMDVVFIRNVLIYFDRETKGKILDKVKKVLRPDGTLFLGTAESTTGLTDGFTPNNVAKSTCFKCAA